MNIGLKINKELTKIIVSLPGNRARNIRQNFTVDDCYVLGWLDIFKLVAKRLVVVGNLVARYNYVSSITWSVLGKTENLKSEEIKRCENLGNKCSKHFMKNQNNDL